MDPQKRKEAEALLESGVMGPADAKALRSALAYQPGEKPAPKSAESIYHTSAAMDAAEEATKAKAAAFKKSELDALNAEESLAEQDAKRTGKSGDFWTDLLGVDPVLRVKAKFIADPRHQEKRYQAGDTGPTAKISHAISPVAETLQELASGALLGNVIGPGKRLAGAIGKGAAAAGGASLATSAQRGESLPEAGTRAALSAGAGGAFSAGAHSLLGSMSAIGRNRRDALRNDADIGPVLKQAEDAGYRTHVIKGLVPDKPTGRRPGMYGVTDEARDLAKKMAPAVPEIDKNLTESQMKANLELYGSQAGQETQSSMPMVQKFHDMITERKFRDGEPIPETIIKRLQSDLESFVSFRRVPKEMSRQVVEETGGLSVPYRLLRGFQSKSPRQLSPVGPDDVQPAQATSGARTPQRQLAASDKRGPGGTDYVPSRTSDLLDDMGKPIKTEMKVYNPEPMADEAGFVAGDKGTVPAPGRALRGRDAPRTRKPTEARQEVRAEQIDEPDIAMAEAAPDDFDVVMIPRQLDARELETVRNVFDSAGGIEKASPDAAAALLAISGAGREMRKNVPGLVELKAKQSAEIVDLKNLKNALKDVSGKRLAENEIERLVPIRRALEQYGKRDNAEADEVLDAFLAKNPEHAAQFKKLKGMVAAEDLRPDARGPQIQSMGSSTGAKVYASGILSRTRLHRDPLMRAMAEARGTGAVAPVLGSQRDEDEKKLTPKWARRVMDLLSGQ